MLSIASASLSFQASVPLAAPRTLAVRANVVAQEKDQVGFQDPEQLAKDAAGADKAGDFCFGMVGFATR